MFAWLNHPGMVIRSAANTISSIARSVPLPLSDGPVYFIGRALCRIHSCAVSVLFSAMSFIRSAREKSGQWKKRLAVNCKLSAARFFIDLQHWSNTVMLKHSMLFLNHLFNPSTFRSVLLYSHYFYPLVCFHRLRFYSLFHL